MSEAGGGAQVLQGEGQVGSLDQKGLTLWTDRNGQAKAYISDSFNRCLDIRAENLGTQWLPASRESGAGNDSSVGVTRTREVHRHHRCRLRHGSRRAASGRRRRR